MSKNIQNRLPWAKQIDNESLQTQIETIVEEYEHETIDGNQLTIDTNDTEALLIRKDGDTGDIFTVDTTNSISTFDSRVIIDETNTEALLVRKNGDSGDVLTVDTTNSQIYFPSGGLVGFPTITFLNDSDTGIRNPLANTVEIDCGGSIIFTLDTTEANFTVPVEFNDGMFQHQVYHLLAIQILDYIE